MDNQNHQMKEFSLSTNSSKNSNKQLIYKNKNDAWKGDRGLEAVVFGFT